MRTVGKVTITILVLALIAFVTIGVVSAITEGGFFDLFRQWFGVAEKTVATIPDAIEGEVASATMTYVKSVINASLKLFKFGF